MAEGQAPNRRQHERAPQQPPLEVKVMAARTVSGVAFDVSEGGMLIDAEMAQPRVGSELQLKFRLPGAKERTMVRAEVVRHADGKKFGVKFLRLDAGQLAAIAAFVKAGG
jgi:c-di-GMP-binding flagellar brake protein YcgR